MNNENKNDEIAGIFDDITPGDFAPFQGRAAFDQFFARHIENTRLSWLAADGQINPIAILANANEEKWVAPTDEETLGEFMERARVAAKEHNAHWLYISRKTVVGTASINESVDTSDPEFVAAALKEGKLETGCFYYVERREGKQREFRFGIMVELPDGSLGKPIEGNPKNQSADFFSSILN